MEIVTACTLDCPDCCSLLVRLEDSGDIRITGNPLHPITAGFTCAKIKRLKHRLRSAHRITAPLLKEGRRWIPIDWETALERCAEEVQQCRGEPESILHIRGDGDKGVLSRVNDLFFAQLGSSRVGGCLCDSTGITACITDFGSLETNEILDLANARWIVNWGKDLSRSSIHVAALVRKARRKGAQVITISPGGDDNRDFSDSMIRIRPGSDRFLAAAVIRRLLKEGNIDDNALKHARNRSVFRELILGRSMSDFSAACDVPEDRIEQLSEYYAKPAPVASLIGWGLQRYRYGGENVRFINALALLSGNIGKSGGGSYFNIFSGRDFNLSWAEGDNTKHRRTLLLPFIGRDILEAVDPPIQMAWIHASNIVNQAPNCNEIARALASIPFTVVVDSFMTDTAEQANLILPCELTLEKEDLVGSFLHNYTNYVRRAVAAPGQARSDHWILSELGKRLDPPVFLAKAGNYLRKSLDSPFLDTSLDDLREKGFARSNRPEIAYENLRFDHPDGKYQLPTALHDEQRPSPDFPLRLLTLVNRKFIHSQVLPEDHDIPPLVRVSPDNPALEGIDLNRDVFLVSAVGRLKVRVKTAGGLHPEAVVYRRGDWMKLGGGANQLVEARLTDMGDGAAFYSQCVRLEN